MAKYHSGREMGYAENDVCQKPDTKCENDGKTAHDIRCSQCGHKLVPENVTFLNDLKTPHAKSIRRLDLFGEKNVTVQEFVNPHDFHFHSIQVNRAKRQRFAVHCTRLVAM